jgi:hypothetical protein
MTETSISQNATILVAIDIAKVRHEVLISSTSVLLRAGLRAFVSERPAAFLCPMPNQRRSS